MSTANKNHKHMELNSGVGSPSPQKTYHNRADDPSDTLHICTDVLTDRGCNKGGQCRLRHHATPGKCLKCGEWAEGGLAQGESDYEEGTTIEDVVQHLSSEASPKETHPTLPSPLLDIGATHCLMPLIPPGLEHVDTLGDGVVSDLPFV
eukprot:1226180-Amphidinium_carterae.1